MPDAMHVSRQADRCLHVPLLRRRRMLGRLPTYVAVSQLTVHYATLPFSLNRLVCERSQFIRKRYLAFALTILRREGAGAPVSIFVLADDCAGALALRASCRFLSQLRLYPPVEIRSIQLQVENHHSLTAIVYICLRHGQKSGNNGGGVRVHAQTRRALPRRFSVLRREEIAR